MQQAHLLFQLGNLQVYTILDVILSVPVWTPDQPVKGWYWRDPAAPQGYGPFNTVSGCIDHYKWFIDTCKTNALLEGRKAPIVRVDFKSKKRVDDA